MINNLTVIHPPPPPVEYRTGTAGTKFFPLARWIEHRAWKPQQNIVYQNLTSARPKQIPWQGGHATTASQQEMARIRASIAAVPVRKRLNTPAYGGVTPEVVAVVEGPVNPWFGGPLSRSRRVGLTRTHTRPAQEHHATAVTGHKTPVRVTDGAAGPSGRRPSLTTKQRSRIPPPPIRGRVVS